MYKSYTQQAAEIGKELQEHFGKFSPRILWLIVRLCKVIRRSCRNNSAFNTAMSSAFPYATFRQVPKVIKYGSRAGQTYQGLQIDVQGEGGLRETYGVEQEESEDEE